MQVDSYFLININISNILYFSKSTSTNAQYSGLWDTLWMMLFTKEHIWKENALAESAEKLVLVYLKILYRIRYKKEMLYLDLKSIIRKTEYVHEAHVCSYQGNLS